MDVLTLAVPSEPGFLGVARIFAATVARRYGCAEERVEDVKVAVSEAVTAAMGSHALELTVRARVEEDLLWFEVPAPERPRAADLEADLDELGADPLTEITLGLTLIRALFPRAEIATADGRGAVIRFAVELAEPDELLPRI